MMQIQKAQNDKSLYPLLPKLYDNYTKALAAIPESEHKQLSPAPVFIFQTATGDGIPRSMTIDQAREALKRRNAAENAIVDIDHEDVTNGSTEA
jgi:hypothetical protein